MGNGPVPSKTAVEQCALVHLRRNLRRAPSSRWSTGSRRPCARAGHWARSPQSALDSASKTCPHGSDLHLDGPGAICRLDSPQLAGFSCLPAARAPPGQRSGRGFLSRLAALGEDLVPGLRLHLPNLLECARRPSRCEPVAQPGLRLPRAARRNHRAGRRLQHPRLRPHARHRCPLCQVGPGAYCCPSPALLPMAAAGARRRYGPTPPRREPQHRPRLVGLRASSIGNHFQLVLRRAECALSCAGSRRPLAQAEVLEGDAGLHPPAQRSPSHRGSP